MPSGVSKTKSKIGSSRDFICILPKRDGVKDTESREKTGTCSQVSEAHSIFYKDRERKSNCAGSHVKISGPKSYPSPSKYNPRQTKLVVRPGCYIEMRCLTPVFEPQAVATTLTLLNAMAAPATHRVQQKAADRVERPRQRPVCLRGCR